MAEKEEKSTKELINEEKKEIKQVIKQQEILEKAITKKEEEPNKPITVEEDTKTFKPFKENSINQDKGSKKILIAFFIIAVLVLILALFSTMFSLVNINNIRILDGVSVKKISLKGLTKEEATQKLEEEFTKQIKAELTLKHGEYNELITGEKIAAQYNVEELVAEAYRVGRDGNIIENNYAILDCMINGKNIEPTLQYDENLLNELVADLNAKFPDGIKKYSYYVEDGKLIITSGKEGAVAIADELKEKLLEAIKTETLDDNVIDIPIEIKQPEAIDIEKIHSEIYVEPKNAYYETNPFTIYPHVVGVDFSITMEEAKNMLTSPAEEYTIALKYTEPETTTNEIGLEAFPDLLSSFSTKYDASNKNRSTNLKLASDKINGTILLPGEEFSYNKVVGERTISAGFKEAHIFSGGKVVDGLGGGICQIATTLYDTVLYANLEVTERRNHGLPAGYVKNGLDATVSYGSIDFKFVNSRKYPIKIVSQVKNGIAKMEIYGVKEEVEYEVRLEPIVLNYVPYKTEYITDNSLAPGEQKVQQSGASGCQTVTYKYLLLNGKVISKTELSRDTYRAINKIVRVGPQ
ncbi:MAG: VanW family protein [Clostridia bacterium]|nr:VanW family protein [Clostridia bacterium]